jgi:hypothetical protein
VNMYEYDCFKVRMRIVLLYLILLPWPLEGEVARLACRGSCSPGNEVCHAWNVGAKGSRWVRWRHHEDIGTFLLCVFDGDRGYRGSDVERLAMCDDEYDLCLGRAVTSSRPQCDRCQHVRVPVTMPPPEMLPKTKAFSVGCA